MNIVLGKVGQVFGQKRAYFLLLMIMFCLGISCGIYTVGFMPESDRNDLINYFNSFIGSMQSQNISYAELLFNVIKKNLILIVPIFIFSLFYFGAPFILIMNLIKGFFLGYTFSFIVNSFKGKGLVLAFASILPQNLIYIPCFIGISIIALALSVNKFKIKILKVRNSHDFFIENSGFRMIIFLCILIFGIVVETYFSPQLIKFVVLKFYS
ncbi:stage II sporulation protein M [Clostridium sp. BJN0001]|uniref:stage II sporulation protein M n=1 Tax=Clostridium sp. BJN0001 TaxID=2930219 RepID=UPI001FD2FA8F|nr:stage II sporulation protein M [Clostridium sp. BJN0001]